MSGKPPKAWRLKNTLLTNEWVNQAIREEIKKYMEINENDNNSPNPLGCSKGCPKRKIYCNPSLSQETRKIPNTKSNSTPKELEAEQQRQPEPSRRREIIKIRAEINNIQSKKTVE